MFSTTNTYITIPFHNKVIPCTLLNPHTDFSFFNSLLFNSLSTLFNSLQFSSLSSLCLLFLLCLRNAGSDEGPLETGAGRRMRQSSVMAVKPFLHPNHSRSLLLGGRAGRGRAANGAGARVVVALPVSDVPRCVLQYKYGP